MSDDFQGPEDTHDTTDDRNSGGDQGVLHDPQSEEQKQTSANYQSTSKYAPPPFFIIGCWQWLVSWWNNPYRLRGNFAEHMTVAVSVVIALIAFLQYGVYRQQKSIMESSGHQTQQLIDAANIQAGAATSISTSAGQFTASANEMNNQSRIAVDEFKKAAKESADISRRAAKNAEDAMRISDQAYVTVTSPQFDLNKGIVSAAVLNSGRIPSGPVDITAHYVVINLPIATETTFDFATQSVEHHWRKTHFDSVPVGTPFTINQVLTVISQDMITKAINKSLWLGSRVMGMDFRILVSRNLSSVMHRFTIPP